MASDEERRRAAAELVRAMPEHEDVRRFDAWLELRPLVAQIDALSEGVEPGHPLAPVVAQLQRGVGWALAGFEDFAGALGRYERALALRLAADPDGLETARSHQDVGQALEMLSRDTEARPHFERALELRKRARDDDPEIVSLLASLIWGPEDDFDSACSHTEEVLAVSTRLFGASHPQTACLEFLVAFHLRARADFHEDAEPRVVDTISLRARADDHQNAALRVLDDPDLAPSWDAVEALMGIPVILVGNRDHDVPLRLGVRAVEMAEALLGNEHPKLASVLAYLGGTQQQAGDFEGAESSFERALAILDRGRDKIAGDALAWLEFRVHEGLADAQAALGRHAAARATYERALELYERRPSRASSRRIHMLDGLAHALGALGELAAARARYDDATNVEVAQPDAWPYSLAMAIRTRGAALLGFGDPEGATALFDRAVATLEARAVHFLDDVLREIARLLLEHEALESALAYHERLLALRSRGGHGLVLVDPRMDERIGVGAITRTIADLRTRIAAAAASQPPTPSGSE